MLRVSNIYLACADCYQSRGSGCRLGQETLCRPAVYPPCVEVVPGELASMISAARGGHDLCKRGRVYPRGQALEPQADVLGNAWGVKPNNNTDDGIKKTKWPI